MEEFRIDNFLTLKLEKENTFIYVKNKKFIQCIKLLINIPENELTKIDTIKSVDDLSEIFEINRNNLYSISPEEEFKAHCSNIQAWVENNYNTKLLHMSIAFPLLKELVYHGNLKARKVFQEEIAQRLESKNLTVISYLVEEDYLKYLPKEYMNEILKDHEFLKFLSYKLLIKLKKKGYKIEDDILRKKWVDNQIKKGININDKSYWKNYLEKKP